MTSTRWRRRTDGRSLAALLAAVATVAVACGAPAASDGQTQADPTSVIPLVGCDPVEEIDFEVGLTAGFGSAQEALDAQLADVAPPEGDFVQVPTDSEDVVSWELRAQPGDVVVGEVTATRSEGGWHLSRARWCAG